MFDTLTTAESLELHRKLVHGYRQLCHEATLLAAAPAAVLDGYGLLPGAYRMWDDTASETFGLAAEIMATWGQP